MQIDRGSSIEIILAYENETLEYAASQLETYLARSFGRPLTVYLRAPGKPPAPVPASACRFVLGGDQKGVFAADRFVLEVSQDRVLIEGTTSRAVLYGVYEFLEQEVGVFWDRPGRDRVPRRDRLDLTPKRRAAEPLLPYRGFYVDSSAKSMTPESTVLLIDWMTKKRANYLLVSVNFFGAFRDSIVPELRRRGTILEVGHHGFVNFVDPALHLGTHPDWFSLVEGERTGGFRRNNMTHDSQLCSSNEEGLSFYADQLAAYLARYPEIDVIGIIPNDGRGWCECDRCRELEASSAPNILFEPGSTRHLQRSASGRYHRIVSFVSHRLNTAHRETVGHRKLSFWAYHATIMPSEAVKSFPENTILSGFALFERCYAHTLDDPRCHAHPLHLNGRYREIMARWNDVYDRPKLVYEYYRKYFWLSKPKIMPRLLQDDIALVARSGFDGVTSMCEMDAWPIYEINQHGFLDYCWRDRQVPAQRYIETFAAQRLPSRADLLSRVFEEVERVMAPFGLLGGRYPREEIDGALEKLDCCLEALGSAAIASCDEAEQRYLRAWRENLGYLRKAFLSDREILDLIGAGTAAAEDLRRVLARDRELLECVESMGSESFLHSEFVTNRLGRRIREVEDLVGRGEAVPAGELRRIWINRWF